jgi:hypothetical protein
MNEYDNQLGLWKRQPQDSDVAGKKYPNYTGKGMVNGKNVEIVAWLGLNKTKDTQPDINIKVNEPKQKSQKDEELPY